MAKNGGSEQCKNAFRKAPTLHQEDALGSKVEVGNHNGGGLEIFKVSTAALGVLCLEITDALMSATSEEADKDTQD